MRVSEVFAMGGGSGYSVDKNGYGPSGNPEGRFRYSYEYYRSFAYKDYGDDGSGFNGGFRNASFSRGRGLVGVLG